MTVARSPAGVALPSRLGRSAPYRPTGRAPAAHPRRALLAGAPLLLWAAGAAADDDDSASASATASVSATATAEADGLTARLLRQSASNKAANDAARKDYTKQSRVRETSPSSMPSALSLEGRACSAVLESPLTVKNRSSRYASYMEVLKSSGYVPADAKDREAMGYTRPWEVRVSK